jgi:hypothetical protein
VTWDFYVGLDLGQRKDYSALAIVECPVLADSRWGVGLALPDGWQFLRHYHPNARRELRALEFRRGGAPSRPVLHVSDVLLIDLTGVGRPVVNQFIQAGLQPMAMTITGGKEVLRDGYDLHVPKRDLITATQVAFQSDRLRIAEQLPEAATLVRELLDFRVKVTTAANDTYGAWREGSHDDLVLALAMATWYREWYCALIDESNAKRARPRVSTG